MRPWDLQYNARCKLLGCMLAVSSWYFQQRAWGEHKLNVYRMPCGHLITRTRRAFMPAVRGRLVCERHRCFPMRVVPTRKVGERCRIDVARPRVCTLMPCRTLGEHHRGNVNRRCMQLRVHARHIRSQNWEFFARRGLHCLSSRQVLVCCWHTSMHKLLSCSLGNDRGSNFRGLGLSSLVSFRLLRESQWVDIRIASLRCL